MSFPRDIDPLVFDRNYRLQPELWRDPFLKLWCAQGPDPSQADAFQAYTDGTNLIASLGANWIMKVFPPILRHQWESEWRVMQHLTGQLTLPIPRFYKAGVWEDWPYIIMSRLSGMTLEKVWPRMPNIDKAAVLRDIGLIMARVHAVPLGDLADLPPQWSQFFPQQIAGCRSRHERQGMPDWFTQSVDAFVRDALPLLPENSPSVILTGEYTPFNLLVTDTSRVQSISGMIDFGDAMAGYREYDLLGPLLFSCEGKPALVQALLTGYGYATQAQNKELRRRLMLLQILHRYSNFNEQVCIPGWQYHVRSIAELEQLIWPLD